MSVAKVTEITASSTKSFEDAIQNGYYQGLQDFGPGTGGLDSGPRSSGERREDN